MYVFVAEGVDLEKLPRIIVSLLSLIAPYSTRPLRALVVDSRLMTFKAVVLNHTRKKAGDLRVFFTMWF